MYIDVEGVSYKRDNGLFVVEFLASIEKGQY